MIFEGSKKFELRQGYFDCSAGDILILKEWNPETKEYTCRILEKIVTRIFKTKNIPFLPKEDIDKFRFQVIGFN